LFFFCFSYIASDCLIIVCHQGQIINNQAEEFALRAHDISILLPDQIAVPQAVTADLRCTNVALSRRFFERLRHRFPSNLPQSPLQPPPTGGGFRSYFCRGIRRSHLPPVGGNEGGRLPQLGEVGGGRGAESLFHHLLAENEIVADNHAEYRARARANY